MKENTHLPKLKPVQLPWMVSPSTSFVRLIAEESPEELQPIRLECVAFFGHASAGAGSKSTAWNVREVEVSNNPHGDRDSKGSAFLDSPYRIVSIGFDLGTRCCFNPGYSDHEVIPVHRYDTSEFPVQFDPEDESDSYSQQCDAYFAQTGCFADPGVYEVFNSPWLNSLKPTTSKLRHFIVEGHDVYVDILAQGLSWKVLRGLPDW